MDTSGYEVDKWALCMGFWFVCFHDSFLRQWNSDANVLGLKMFGFNKYMESDIWITTLISYCRLRNGYNGEFWYFFKTTTWNITWKNENIKGYFIKKDGEEKVIHIRQSTCEFKIKSF